MFGDYGNQYGRCGRGFVAAGDHNIMTAERLALIFPPAADIITLTTGELAITKNLTIVGSTSKSLTISGNNTSRIFNVNAAMNFTFVDD
jgi:hypothetical protein